MPKIAQAYNSFMGGMDRNDQVTKLCKIRRHYKWPRRLLVKFFMWAVYNAYIIHDYHDNTNNLLAVVKKLSRVSE